ncbi:hypothetical protein KP509_35G022600 [Ceratopteris richardii]|uniref:Uncharacterized protein n=1 Tax=Ceratopteris richardii TaxID=49495 RepID=A0A8T2QF64_CERRI|nr:hypothetical protein KP509_35G022600 [Ceratopteris richardii]KAH7282269.1 hypothetical protein KP509_35G022600 [Ceratopteris richardii]KAH7282270.1 hypothetical protein KP509_35G022600 [Ceratopteris richardii]
MVSLDLRLGLTAEDEHSELLIHGSLQHIVQNASGILLHQRFGSPSPAGWEQCLDLKSGILFFRNLITGRTILAGPRQSLLPQTGSRCSHGRPVERHESADVHNGSSTLFGQTDDVDLDFRLSTSLSTGSWPMPAPACSSSSSSPSSSSSSSASSRKLSQCTPHSCISDAHSRQNAIPSRCRITYSSSKAESSILPSPWLTQPPSPAMKGCSKDQDGETQDSNHITREEIMSTAACTRCLMFVLVNSCSNEAMRCPMCGCYALTYLQSP